jgi:hypothetical protein
MPDQVAALLVHLINGGSVLDKRDLMRKLSSEDRRIFDRWMKANAIIGSLLAAGLFAMAVAGAPSARPSDGASAGKSNGHGIAASSQSRLAPAP